MSELLPCPFCGANAADDKDPVARRITCKTPDCAMFNYSTTAEAWSRRAWLVPPYTHEQLEAAGRIPEWLLEAADNNSTVRETVMLWRRDGHSTYYLFASVAHKLWILFQALNKAHIELAKRLPPVIIK